MMDTLEALYGKPVYSYVADGKIDENAELATLQQYISKAIDGLYIVEWHNDGCQLSIDISDNQTFFKGRITFFASDNILVSTVKPTSTPKPTKTPTPKPTKTPTPKPTKTPTPKPTKTPTPKPTSGNLLGWLNSLMNATPTPTPWTIRKATPTPTQAKEYPALQIANYGEWSSRTANPVSMKIQLTNTSSQLYVVSYTLYVLGYDPTNNWSKVEKVSFTQTFAPGITKYSGDFMVTLGNKRQCWVAVGSVTYSNGKTVKLEPSQADWKHWTIK